MSQVEMLVLTRIGLPAGIGWRLVRQFDILHALGAGGDGMPLEQLKRREFITLLGGAATAGRCGMRAAADAPVIAFLNVASPKVERKYN